MRTTLAINAAAACCLAGVLASGDGAQAPVGDEPEPAITSTDPSPTLAQFQAYVASGQIHYLLASGGMGAMGGSSTETSTTSQILAWAAASYQTVSIDGTTFYDLTQPLAAS